MGSLLKTLYTASQSVFTLREIALLGEEKNLAALRSRVFYWVKSEKLIRLRRGIFAKSDQYDRNELATRLYTPAYVSFETILAREGVIFQFYDSIFVASYMSRETVIGGQKFICRKMKDTVLSSKEGLIDKGTYFEASRERAFLDLLYFFKDAQFDNLRSIDWVQCQKLVSIYQNKRLEKAVSIYQKEYAQQK